MNTFILSFLLVCGANQTLVQQPYSNYGDAIDQMQSLEDAGTFHGKQCSNQKMVIGNAWDLYRKSDTQLDAEIQKQVQFAQVKTNPKETLKF
jgi:hypothetical protein